MRREASFRCFLRVSRPRTGNCPRLWSLTIFRAVPPTSSSSSASASNEIIRGKLLSTDGKLTLIVLALNPDAIQSNRLSRIVEDIRQDR